LKDQGRTASAGPSQTRLRAVFVTGEIALALFLLVGTGLLFSAILRLNHQNLGLQPARLLTAGITLDEARYKDDSQREAFVRNLLPRVRQIPGAESAAVSSDLPFSGQGTVTVRVQGQPDLPANQVLTTTYSAITPDFFRAAGISVLRGRTFSEQDNHASPQVALANQKFVDRYLKGEDGIGKQIRLEVSGAPAGWTEIVGVVNNLKSDPQSAAEAPAVYVPFEQHPVASFSLVVRATNNPDNLISGVRNSVAQLDSDLPLAHLMSMAAIIARQNGPDTFFTRSLAGFAFLALALAAIGIYGLIAYSVGQRVHEIGIRVALGARSDDVLRMVIREGMKMALIGSAIGFTLSLPLPKVFESMFFDLHVQETRLYVLVPLVILLTATVASYIPAHRASRIDPMAALRQD
jgi:putative ABC transport system permease protein